MFSKIYCVLIWIVVLLVDPIRALATTTNATPVNATTPIPLYGQCVQAILNGTYGSSGGSDNQGHFEDITENTTAITYNACIAHCNFASEPFVWSDFSQQFGAWLLPWLALISVLPFGANDKLDNLDSVLLAVGSPALAAYSLALTILNGRWITKSFFPFKQHPNAYTAVRALNSLQQAPIRINANYHLLEALVTMPENRKWWRELVTWLDLTPNTWSISAVTSISWVIIAYIFTVADSLTQPHSATGGQGVGSIWLWLLPLVIGWLQISPKCDSEYVFKAVDKANAVAWVLTNTGNRLAQKDSECAIYLESAHSVLRSDEYRSPPIFNYARIWAWVQAVEEVADTFRFAVQEPLTPPLTTSPASTSFEPPSSATASFEMTSVDGILALPRQQRRRSESRSLVTTLSLAHAIPNRSRWGHGTWWRILVAGFLGLFLQWGTTGAAIIVTWFSPTIGLGCRSGTYILYGTISTLVWLAMLLSSILSHCALTAPFQHAFSTRAAEFLSILLRRLGKITAACNGIGLVITCLLQFGNFFDSCWCNSSVLYWGTARAYDVIKFNPEDIIATRHAWIGSVFLGAGSALIFFFFVNLYINPTFPHPEHDH